MTRCLRIFTLRGGLGLALRTFAEEFLSDAEKLTTNLLRLLANHGRAPLQLGDEKGDPLLQQGPYESAKVAEQASDRRPALSHEVESASTVLGEEGKQVSADVGCHGHTERMNRRLDLNSPHAPSPLRF